MPATRSKSTQAQKPTFVFKGTIKKLKSATMKGVPVDERTVVVTVNQIIEAPPALADYNGQDITVQLGGRQKVRAGQELIFHTASWIFGESIAVRSLTEDPVTARSAAMLSAADDPVERRAQRGKRDRFDAADLVVSGKVVAVRLPAGTAKRSGAASLAASDQAPGGPVSEHDPKWREAVIQVDEVHKGSHKKKQVVLRFPASKDSSCCTNPKPKRQRPNEAESGQEKALSRTPPSPMPRLVSLRLTRRSIRLTFNPTTNPGESKRSSIRSPLSRKVNRPDRAAAKEKEEEEHACQKNQQEDRDLS